MTIGIPFGKYRLTRRLARGGMAEVFLASQQGPGGFERTVAVKRILPHLADIPQFLEMFMDEARLAAQLSHPNIAHIYEFGEVDDSFFIAMEYVDGIDLSAVVLDGPRRPLPLAHAARIIADVCAALHHAHLLKGKDGSPLGLVHRDISPQNILVSFDGAVKMVDFGIAKAAYHIERTKPGVVRGKFTYMSPEQVLGKSLDARSDLFSAGIVLYELCTCQALFPRTDAVQAMQMIRRAEVPEPRRDGDPLPPGLTAIIRRALAGDRNERYQSAAEMQMDLEEYLRSESQISNSLLLAAYFREHYRRLRPDPAEEEEGSAEGVGATRHVAGTVRVGARPAATEIAEGGAATRVVVDEGSATHLLDPPPLPAPTTSVSGMIYDQATVQKTVPDAEDDLADTRFSLHSTLVGADARRTSADTGELESPTVEIVTGPGALPAVDEGRTTIDRSAPRPALRGPASTTVAIRRIGRRLVVILLIAGIAAAGVAVGYVISSPPDPVALAAPDMGPSVELDLTAGALALTPDMAPTLEGTLVLNSDPPGASVRVDGLLIAGVTPVRRSFPAGSHTLVVSLPGHASQEQEVVLEAGQVRQTSFVLRRSQPEKVVQLRQPRPPRETAARRRKRPRRRHVARRRPRRTKPRRASKPPASPSYGYLNVTSIPWSWVYLGRRKLGQTPLARVKVPVGTHRLFFSNPKSGETYRTVIVEPDRVTKVRVTLK